MWPVTKMRGNRSIVGNPYFTAQVKSPLPSEDDGSLIDKLVKTSDSCIYSGNKNDN